MKLANMFVVIACLVLISTLSIAAEKKKDAVVVVVNGKEITASMLQAYQKSRGFIDNISKKQQIQMMVEELINRELIYQDAVKNKVDKSDDVQAQLDLMRKNVVAGAMLKNVTEAAKISDEELKKEYDKRKDQLATTEYKASHILVESEDDAKTIIAEIDKGANFADLAKKKSTGPSATHGGDLGWFKSDEMVKPFAVAVEGLKNGEYTKTPVKSDFGWHVILRENSREVPPPPYEQMREQLKMRVQNLQIEQYIASLRKEAKIERKSSDK
ncbi:peptidylprolyl isomerase [Kaarinaea lacus]